MPFFFVKHDIPILFSVNCERTNLFSVNRDLDPPPLPPSIFNNLHHKSLQVIEILIK